MENENKPLTPQQKGAITKKRNLEEKAAKAKPETSIEEPKPEVPTEPELKVDIVKAMSLREKMLYVQRELAKTGIGRTKEGTQYSTRSIDDLINTMSIVLTKARIILQPNVLSTIKTILETKNSSMQHCKVTMRYGFLDVDSDQYLTVDFSGEAADMTDKSTQKAITNAYKYMMIQTYNIPLVGSLDPDLYQDVTEMTTKENIIIAKEDGSVEVVNVEGVDLDEIYSSIYDEDIDDSQIPIEYRIEAIIIKTGIDKTRDMWDKWVAGEKLTQEQQLVALLKRDAQIVKETEEGEEEA